MEFDIPYFELDTTGGYFVVLIFDEFVIKIPRKQKEGYKERLKEIARIQTELSEKVEGVLPCYCYGGYLVMPRAKGERLDRLKHSSDRVGYLKRKALDEIKEHGYELKDATSRNIFYDIEEDKIYFVDFHQIREAEQVSRRGRKR